MLTPTARGALSGAVLEALRSGDTGALTAEPDSAEDAQLALWSLFELHHQGFDDVADFTDEIAELAKRTAPKS